MWLEKPEHTDTICIKRAICTIKAFLFADYRKVIARKTKSKCIKRMISKKRIISANIQIPDITTVYTCIFVILADIMPICLASRFIEVIGPRMNNAVIIISNVRPHSTAS